MSSSIPGHGAAVPGSDPRSAPVARISRAALVENARSAWERGIRSFASSILEADAWGHGADLVRGVLEAQGFVADERAHARPGPDLEAWASPESAGSISGAALLGLPGTDAAAVLRLTGTVLSVKQLRTGEGVSYGYLYRAAADTRVALVTGGYAQGIVRELGGRAHVAIAGERHPIVGRVAMDVCVVEIGGAAVHRDDEVLFLGDPTRAEPSLGEWVRSTPLSAAELITMVGLRAMREEAP